MIKPRRILLVEDDSMEAELTLAALEECDLASEVVVARDGEEALDYLHCRNGFTGREAGNPAVMLLDLKLPKLDGIEVLQHIRSNENLKLMPVVVLTSSNHERDVTASYEYGVNAYVVKPVDFGEFVKVIKQLAIFWTVNNEPPPGSLKR